MKNINDNYDFPKRLTLYLLLGYLVFTLLFSQPLSVMLSVITNFRVNFAYINVFIGVIIILLVSRRSYIEASTILAIVFLIVSSFITFTFSGFESIISSISYIVQSISALLLISYSKSQRRDLSLKNMCWIFFIFTIPSIIIGFIQNISNSPVFLEYVLKSQDISLNTINNVWQFGDKTRAFGLFYTNGYYGFYLVFLIILFVCRIIFGRRRRILYEIGRAHV